MGAPGLTQRESDGQLVSARVMEMRLKMGTGGYHSSWPSVDDDRGCLWPEPFEEIEAEKEVVWEIGFRGSV